MEGACTASPRRNRSRRWACVVVVCADAAGSRRRSRAPRPIIEERILGMERCNLHRRIPTHARTWTQTHDVRSSGRHYRCEQRNRRCRSHAVWAVGASGSSSGPVGPTRSAPSPPRPATPAWSWSTSPGAGTSSDSVTRRSHIRGRRCLGEQRRPRNQRVRARADRRAVRRDDGRERQVRALRHAGDRAALQGPRPGASDQRFVISIARAPRDVSLRVQCGEGGAQRAHRESANGSPARVSRESTSRSSCPEW